MLSFLNVLVRANFCMLDLFLWWLWVLEEKVSCYFILFQQISYVLGQYTTAKEKAFSDLDSE